MKNWNRMARLAAVLLMMPTLYGCATRPAGPDDDGDPNDVVQDGVDGNSGSAVDDEAADLLDDLLEGGDEPVDALIALSDALADEPAVLATAVDEDQSELWVVYESGEQVLYGVETIDDTFVDAADFGGLDDGDFIDAAKVIDRTTMQTLQESDDLIPGLTTSAYTFPGSSNAILVNAIQSCVVDIRTSDYDSTKGISQLLQRIGYTVDRSNGSLEVFKTLPDYGVVFIEARTSRQTASELLDVLYALPTAFEEQPTHADIEGSSEVITTSTVVTPALRAQYADDLRFGRLKVRRSWYFFQGQLTRCAPTFGVTPNFMRQHATGRFPEHALLYVSAGKLINETTLASDWQAFLAEKSTNSHFVSWAGAPKYAVAKLAAANFFELLTGAEFKYKLTSTTTPMPDGTTLVDDELNTDSVNPPLTNVGMTDTWTAMTISGDTVDLTTAALLWRTSTGPETVSQQLALAPVLDDFYIDQLGHAMVLGGGPTGTQARFTDAGLAYDLGAYGPPELDNAGVVFGGWGYHFDVPVGVAETLALYDELGRHSAAVTVYTWKPVFTVTGEGPDGETYTISFQLVARGLPAPRSRGTVSPLDIYSAPRTNIIDARFDSTASTVSWSVSGSSTVGQFHDEYSGGGLAQLTFRNEYDEPTEAKFSTYESDGATAAIELDIDIELTFTQTRTDTESGQTTVTERTLPLPILWLADLSIDGTLTLSAGSQSIDSSDGDWTATASWGETAPSPSFRAVTGRR